MDKTEHWENVYQTKSSAEVSWYEPDPKLSLDMIFSASGTSHGRVIDIGGGQSFLVDRLLDAGFSQIAVLDISRTAIEATKARLGERASQVEWIVADITQRDSLGEFDIWHDRAVFHFITDPDAERSMWSYSSDPYQLAAISSLGRLRKEDLKSVVASRSANTTQQPYKKRWAARSYRSLTASTGTTRLQEGHSNSTLVPTNVLTKQAKTQAMITESNTNPLTKSRSSKIETLMIALIVNFFAALSYGQAPAAQLLEDAQAAFGVIASPSQEEIQKPIVQLGRHLFWDTRLSANGKVACASCHAANTWGADSERYSQDAKGKLTKRNSQTVFNSMLQPHLR